MRTVVPWDYLIVTASNESQARAYRSQVAVRQQLGLLPSVRQALVVADPEGRRVGSGGSTIYCLMQVLNSELGKTGAPAKPSEVESILRKLRILIVHAGGDSRRLPAYGSCGKIFIPVPGKSESALGLTLFDRLVPAFLELPPAPSGLGQVVMTAGDALILFDSSNISFTQPGLTALACPASPEHASKHGVFCPDNKGGVRLYLQKPRPEQQKQIGALDPKGQSLLDIGVMSFDASVTMALFKAFGVTLQPDGNLDWSAPVKQQVLAHGIDFYREICCALGSEATAGHHRQQTRSSGSVWADKDLQVIFQGLAGIAFHLQIVPECRFLHFGSTRQLITSGSELREYDRIHLGASSSKPQQPVTAAQQPVATDVRRLISSNVIPAQRSEPPHAGCYEILSLNNKLGPGGELRGASAWVEGCTLRAPLTLAGQNVVVGVDVSTPLSLPAGACLDLLEGTDRQGQRVRFVRCYGIGDTFKDTLAKGATFCDRPMREWLSILGLDPKDVWPGSRANPPAEPWDQCSLWEARVFPAVARDEDYRHWLWMYSPEYASPEQKQAFLRADRYSAAEIALLSDQDTFFARRGAWHKSS